MERHLDLHDMLGPSVRVLGKQATEIVEQLQTQVGATKVRKPPCRIRQENPTT